MIFPYDSNSIYHFPAWSKSNASLIWSNGILCEMNESSGNVPSIASLTSFGTLSRLFQPEMFREEWKTRFYTDLIPPKAVPFHVRPVTNWNGRVFISWPLAATPTITLTPQPILFQEKWKSRLFLFFQLTFMSTFKSSTLIERKKTMKYFD